MVLEYRNLFKAFGEKQVLRGVSFTAEPGEILLLTGPSGCGKSTLLRILMGLLKADAGDCPKGVRCSCAFQDNRLLPHLSALRNLNFVSDREDLRKLLAELLPEKDLDLPVEKLSGGMQRRVAIARAMAADSDLVLLDEPLNGLDEKNEKNAVEFILRHQDKRPVLIVSHRLEPFDGLKHRLLRMEDGKISEENHDGK